MGNNWAILVIVSILILSTIPLVDAQVAITIPPGTDVLGCEQTNECYIPWDLIITEGDTVGWFNVDTAAHTATSGIPGTTDGAFDSGLIMPGDSFSHTFTQAGQYPYFCLIHPWMIGVVHVDPATPVSLGGTTAVLQTDKVSYPVGGDIIITLIDPDLDTSTSPDLLSLDIIEFVHGGQSTKISNSIFVPSDNYLIETASNSGIFQIVIEIPQQIGTNTISAGDTVELRYTDKNNVSGQTQLISVKVSIVSSGPTGGGLTAPPGTDVIINFGTGAPGCEVTNTCWTPAALTAMGGDTVGWFNADTAAHTVTSGVPGTVDGNFDSSLMMSGDSFSHTFTQAGQYPYFCMVHPWMTGSIIVAKSPSPTDTVPPIILVPNDMTVQSSVGIIVDFQKNVMAIDNVDGNLKTSCNPPSGSRFLPGTTITVTCSAIDGAGNSGDASFDITVQSQLSIKSWIKVLAQSLCNGDITKSNFVAAIEYLINNGIITVSVSSSGSVSGATIPDWWVTTNACWWSQGLISDSDFAQGIQWLINNGIIII